MVDVPAQDLQAPHNRATQIAAQVEKFWIVEGVIYSHYLQLIATGGVGVHGAHVRGHVVGAVSLVQGQKLGHITVGVPAQDLQVPQHHVTHIIAQVRKKIWIVEAGNKSHYFQ